MRGPTHIALATLGTALLATAAQAKVYVEFRPRMSLMGGYDDNVQLNGTGGDGFGQAMPGLKLDVFGEHDLHIDLDCQAGIARLAHPEQFGLSSGAFAGNETCLMGTKLKLSDRDKLDLHVRSTYAQDPFSIAGLGLLLRPGQTQIFVGGINAGIIHALSGRTELQYGVDTYTLLFGAGDPGNGYMIAPRAAYAWKTSARGKWDLGVREQLFFGVGAQPNPLAPNGVRGGLLDEAHAGMLGYTYELTPWAEMSVHAGAVAITGPRDALQPTARFQIESYTPTTALSLLAMHDLVIGPSSAGPLMADVAEVGWIQDWEHFQAHLRLGIYRNSDAFRFSDAPLGTVGYGTEAGLAWKFTRDLRMEVAAMRDARLSDPDTAALVNRDVVQMRLVWEKARFE